MLLNCGVGEDAWESLGLQGDPTSPSSRKSVLIHWKDWCWSWNSNTLATWCEELTHYKRPWCWERSKVGGEGVDRRWDGWMASPTRWTWVWVSSGSWWWTGKPGRLQSMGSKRFGYEWLNWTELIREIIHAQRTCTGCSSIKRPFFFKFYFIFKLYITVLVLPNIKMNPPQVYMCSPSWTLLPPPSPFNLIKSLILQLSFISSLENLHTTIRTWWFPKEENRGIK